MREAFWKECADKHPHHSVQMQKLSLIPALGGLAFAVSYLGTRAVEAWGARLHLVDLPNDRSSHRRPIHTGAGLAIVSAVGVGLVACAVAVPQWLLKDILPYSAGGLMVATVSFADDISPVSAGLRLIVHVAAALVFVSLSSVMAIGHAWWQPWSLAVGAVTIIWVVGVTNAFNFMDGIDGLAGSQAVVAGVGWAILGWSCGDPMLLVLGVLVGAASFGFLSRNWSPARVFLGDVGSAFLGYTFGVLPIVALGGGWRLAIAGSMVMWPFLFDSSFTLVRRLLKRENVFVAHRCHLYQRLVASGQSHRSVTAEYVVLDVIGLALGLAWVWGVPHAGYVLGLLLCILSFVLWYQVIRCERKSLE